MTQVFADGHWLKFFNFHLLGMFPGERATGDVIWVLQRLPPAFYIAGG